MSLKSREGSEERSCWNSGMGTSRLTTAPVCFNAVERNMETAVWRRETPPPILHESGCRSVGRAPHSLPEWERFLHVPRPGMGCPSLRAVMHLNSESLRCSALCLVGDLKMAPLPIPPEERKRVCWSAGRWYHSVLACRSYSMLVTRPWRVLISRLRGCWKSRRSPGVCPVQVWPKVLIHMFDVWRSAKRSVACSV